MNFAQVTVRSPICAKVNCMPAPPQKMRTLAGKCKYLRTNCKICTKTKFAKNCDFARKGEICTKIAPRKITIFFRDWMIIQKCWNTHTIYKRLLEAGLV